MESRRQNVAAVARVLVLAAVCAAAAGLPLPTSAQADANAGPTSTAQAGGGGEAQSPARGAAKEPTVTSGDSPVGNAERLALRLESIALDMHLDADSGAVTTRAQVKLRNGGATPLSRVALQVSSALLWQSARVVDAGGGGTRLPVQQFRVTTDADHTGAANELLLNLPKPLPPGAPLALDLFYGGTLTRSAERLLRLGAPEERAAAADWDGASGAFVGLRGFGNVLWYPVSAPAALLADGDGFAKAVDAERERTAGTTMQLSLVLEHTERTLTAAWFLDQPATLLSPLRRREGGSVERSGSNAGASSGTDSAPTGASGSVEADPEQSALDTARWEALRLDGRPVSLFIAGESEAGTDTGATATGPMPAKAEVPGETGLGEVRMVGGEALIRQNDADAADRVRPLLTQWLPARGAMPLTVIPLPSPGAQTFADGDLLVTPAHASTTAAQAEALVYPLAAAAVPGDAPAWVREGVPEFLRLLYLETTGGRDRMVAELAAMAPALRQTEATPGMEPLPLRSCVDPVCARSKAAFALMMLRGIAGDVALQQAIHAMLLPSGATGERNAAEGGREMTRRFEAALRQSSGKDLGWFFADWFSADRGLPDLQIVEVAPRRVERGAATVTEPTRRGPRLGPLGTEPQAEADDTRRTSPTAASRNTAAPAEGSWLVAVEVQNNGDAAAEVPVTVRAAGLQNRLPLRVPAHGRATVRVPFETTPEEVWVNDGTTPEQRGLTHHRSIEITR